MSRNDIWQPKQPANDVVAILILCLIIILFSGKPICFMILEWRNGVIGLALRHADFGYIGFDQMPEFIAGARARYADRSVISFCQTDFTTAALL